MTFPRNMGNIFGVLTRRNNNGHFPRSQRLHIKEDVQLMPIRVTRNVKTVSTFKDPEPTSYADLDSCMTILNLT